MGEEILSSEFSAQDFTDFKHKLENETEQLAEIFAQRGFAESPPVAGFELEAWLVDEKFRPVPRNEEFLARLSNPLASPELASFNIEVNTEPRLLQGHVFSAMHQSLDATWADCRATAQALGMDVIMCGILPSLLDEDLTLANMSGMQRYRALNREVLLRRKGKPLVLDINGVEHLRVSHHDVMLESAATSFQLHTQINQTLAARLYNASLVLSAPMVALCANSPYLFGKDLWDESRIPLFEQAVATGGYDAAAFGPIRRVTFGSGYVRESLLECFTENLAHYPVLLPVNRDSDCGTLPHLRMHNGTIWRWNRPLIGFDDKGEIHLRIEHRVIPSGPSSLDAVANAAFYYGVAMALVNLPTAVEWQLPFDKARDNFYRAAQLGLRAPLHWLDDKSYAASELLSKILLPLAFEGLERLGVAGSDRDEYLGIIRQRLESGTNGAVWQRAFVDRHGRDMQALTAAYFQHQQSGLPVHEWEI
ncbi:MAG: glutamate--cysteine ligase [Gammaproteobacteria bacterium]|jgi:gamma-glutamyl:cysteine ligase YbdK (ATP-grasp superfamily)